jgi:hypothetical protein
VRSFKIAIPDDAADRLRELAAQEYRRPREQAAAIVVAALRRAEPAERDAGVDGRSPDSQTPAATSRR